MDPPTSLLGWLTTAPDLCVVRVTQRDSGMAHTAHTLVGACTRVLYVYECAKERKNE